MRSALTLPKPMLSTTRPIVVLISVIYDQAAEDFDRKRDCESGDSPHQRRILPLHSSRDRSCFVAQLLVNKVLTCRAVLASRLPFTHMNCSVTIF
jgi:hypothetical protein